MDTAYDHIQEETITTHEDGSDSNSHEPSNLNSEFQQAFKAVSSSPWGAALGGFLGQVKKQGETLYSDAQKEVTNASAQATRGLTDLRSSIVERTRAISITADAGSQQAFVDPLFDLPDRDKPQTKSATVSTASQNGNGISSHTVEKPESLPADILKEATSIASRFRPEAAKWLKDVQRAEDAADEALLKFGTNVRNFLRDTITVTPSNAAGKEKTSEVIFETNDAEGRRVFHSNRFDAQLHVIHATADRFLTDPEGQAWDAFAKEFDVQKETDRIATDLDKYDDLRRTMSKLVPAQVEYAAFWKRYYFLRAAVEEEEKRRREVLKGAAAAGPHEDIGWGDDDDDEEDSSSTPVNGKTATTSAANITAAVDANAGAEGGGAAHTTTDTLKAPSNPSQSATSPRRSQDGSDASYDIVSGATTRTASSPKDEKEAEVPPAGAKTDGAASKVAVKKDDSDEEDWE